MKAMGSGLLGMRSQEGGGGANGQNGTPYLAFSIVVFFHVNFPCLLAIWLGCLRHPYKVKILIEIATVLTG